MSTGCQCAPGLCVDVTTDTAYAKGKKSPNMDANSQVNGLYPAYFEDAISFVVNRTRTAGNQSVIGRSSPVISFNNTITHPTGDEGVILLIERVNSQKKGERARDVVIANHADLLAGLQARFGRRRVVSANLDAVRFGDQVRLFGRAQVVIGQHGAGLTNVLFSPPSAFLLELCPRLHSMVRP